MYVTDCLPRRRYAKVHSQYPAEVRDVHHLPPTAVCDALHHRAYLHPCCALHRLLRRMLWCLVRRFSSWIRQVYPELAAAYAVIAATISVQKKSLGPKDEKEEKEKEKKK